MVSWITLYKKYILLVGIGLVLFGCQANPDPISNYPDNGTQQPEGLLPLPSTQETGTLENDLDVGKKENQNESIISATATSIPHQKPHYSLVAEFNYGSHHLNVKEKITYYNNSPDLITEMLLMVEPANYLNVFSLINLATAEGNEITEYRWGEGQLIIPLAAPLDPGEKIEFLINYELDLPSPERSEYIRPIPFGYTERQSNLVDWYPFVPPYVPGDGWVAHKPAYYGEHLVYDIADFDVEIKLLDDRTDMVIAASASDNPEGEWHHYHFENARNFVWSVSHVYQVSTKTEGSVTIHSYAFPVHAAAGEAVLQTTSEALNLYSELFGPYPRDLLSVVEADFLDGMEYDGLYFLSNGFYNLYTQTPGEYLIAIAAHETAHQWWYAMVANDQALEPWLDEALCTYSERLYYENIHPEALDWWWDYRIFYYQPAGWVSDSIYNPHGVTNAYRSYRDAVYLNGALFMEDLRLLIGDESFFPFLRKYAESYKFQIASTRDFFDTLQKHHQVDISGLVNKYFENLSE